MKLNKWLFGAAAMAMLAACSDNFDGPDPTPEIPVEEGQGYIGVNIQMPTVSGTRANDNFGNGEESEYAIHDAALLLFQGTSESTAVFTGAYTLLEANTSAEADGGQVSRRAVRVANVTGIKFNSGNKLYALVIVNGESNGLYTQANPEASWMRTENPGTDGKNIGKTIRALQETILNKTSSKFYDQTKDGEEYASNIVMVNSPLSPVKGGMEENETEPTVSSALPVLVNLSKKTYPTQNEAIEKPAGTIHVERIVGKVTCSEFNRETSLTVTVGGYDYNLEVDSIWWDMAQDMSETYVVRNTNRNKTAASSDYLWRWSYASSRVETTSNNYYRMLGYTPIPFTEYVETQKVVDGKTVTVEEPVSRAYYRPYFCQVPHYGEPSTADNKDGAMYENKTFTKESMVFDRANTVKWTIPANATTASGPGAFYPLENTFPVDYMKYANTTRVGFWVTFKFKPVTKDGVTSPAITWKTNNFYVKGIDKHVLYTDDPNGFNPLENLAIEELSDQEEYKTMWAAIDAALDKEGDQAGSISNVNIADLIKFTPKATDDGKVAFESIQFKEITDLPAKYAGYFKSKPAYSFSAQTIGNLNALGAFYKYEGGRSFYEVRIKHFGEDNTPWSVDASAPATDIAESYGEDATERIKNFLGRYGIVRNNWYDIKVTLIKNLGDPMDPQLWSSSWPGKPDDNKDQYIAVELRVLSWAKRSQDIEF